MNRLFLSIIYFIILIKTSLTQPWVDRIYELQPYGFYGSNNWGVAIDTKRGRWQAGSTFCSGFYGEKLERSVITRNDDNLPYHIQSRISFELCFGGDIKWDDDEFIEIAINGYNYKMYKSNTYFSQSFGYSQNLRVMFKSDEAARAPDEFQCWGIRNFRFEIQCQAGCDQCNKDSGCTCNSPRFWIDKQICSETCSDGYFKFFDSSQNKNVCKNCDNKCQTCTGPTEFDCISCKDQNLKVQLQYNGQKECKVCPPDNYYIYGNDCLRCDSSCLKCNGTTTYDCTTCQYNMKYWIEQSGKKQCKICPDDNYYISGDNCYKCDSSCLKCNGTTAFDCTKCQNNLKFYIDQNNQKKCITCPLEKFYVSGDYCKDCFQSCLKCIGPLSSNCTQCKSHYYSAIV